MSLEEHTAEVGDEEHDCSQHAPGTYNAAKRQTVGSKISRQLLTL